MLKYNNYLFVFIMFFLFLSGCSSNLAINRSENYSNAWPTINSRSKNKILVGVIDNRPYVVSGHNNPSYIGLMRGGYYNPWYMNTQSGKPLSIDLSEAIVSGFMNSGIESKFVSINVNADKNELEEIFLSDKKYKKLLLVIDEWQSDTYKTTVFLYDVSLSSYNENGEKTGEYREKNTDKSGEQQTAVSAIRASQELLTRALNNSSIATNLFL